MPTSLLRPFPLFVLTAAAADAGIVGFTASAGIRDDMTIASVVAIAAAAIVIAALVRQPGFVALVARPPAWAQAPIPCWLLLAITFGTGSSLPPRWSAVWTTAQTIIAFVLVAIAMREVREPAPADHRVAETPAPSPSPIPA